MLLGAAETSHRQSIQVCLGLQPVDVTGGSEVQNLPAVQAEKVHACEGGVPEGFQRSLSSRAWSSG